MEVCNRHNKRRLLAGYNMSKKARFLEKPVSRKRRLSEVDEDLLVISMRKVSFSVVGFVHKATCVSKIQRVARKFIGGRHRAATKIQAFYRGCNYRRRLLHLLKFAFYK